MQNEILKTLLKNVSNQKMQLLTMNDKVTTIEAERFEKGMYVNIVTDEKIIALPEGIYELDNKKFLEVVDEGIVNYYGDTKPNENAVLSKLKEISKTTLAIASILSIVP